MEKYPQIRPADVYITIDQLQAILEDRRNGVPHPEITSIRLTGNNFMDLFASLIENGGGTEIKQLAKRMGVKPRLLGAAIEAMSGLPGHEWATQYVHLSACDKLRYRHYGHDLTALAHRLGFRSVSAFSHFFYRRERCYPSQYMFHKHK